MQGAAALQLPSPLNKDCEEGNFQTSHHIISWTWEVTYYLFIYVSGKVPLLMVWPQFLPSAPQLPSLGQWHWHLENPF